HLERVRRVELGRVAVAGVLAAPSPRPRGRAGGRALGPRCADGRRDVRRPRILSLVSLFAGSVAWAGCANRPPASPPTLVSASVSASASGRAPSPQPPPRLATWVWDAATVLRDGDRRDLLRFAQTHGVDELFVQAVPGYEEDTGFGALAGLVEAASRQ